MTEPQSPRLLNRTSHASPFMEIRQTLASRVMDISPFVEHLMSFVQPLIATVSAMDGSEADIEIALREALCNAVVHGNHEDPQKKVYVTFRFRMDGEISITVQDEGKGFNPDVLADPTDGSERLLCHGRGVYLMQALMDEVSFENKGNIVHMKKRLGPSLLPGSITHLQDPRPVVLQ
ncbi:MAG: ATP-binding protein [Acidobacteriaceae bacterium]|nr:ATP-binding protein [Acidobacteriaceae bacterium]MBV9294471.1 ATP-binding protein [Acidobacteriaceae bacterium]